MRINLRSVALTGALVAMATAWMPSVAQAQYYEGKTIEIIVGFASGGTDTTARIVARRLSDYIDGNPTVVVKNMPGSASLKAQNFVFEQAKPDGTTFSFNPFQVMAQLTGREGVRFSYPEFTFIAGVKAPSFVAVARSDLAEGGHRSFVRHNENQHAPDIYGAEPVALDRRDVDASVRRARHDAHLRARLLRFR